MSLPHSSSDSSSPAATGEDVRRQLERYLAHHMRPGFFGQLALRLQDPFSDKKGFRLNPAWLGLAVLLALATAVFLYFNFVRQ